MYFDERKNSILTWACFWTYLYSCLHLNCHFRYNFICLCTLSKKFVLWSFFPDNSSVIMTDSEVEYNAFQVLFEPSMQWIVFCRWCRRQTNRLCTDQLSHSSTRPSSPSHQDRAQHIGGVQGAVRAWRTQLLCTRLGFKERYFHSRQVFLNELKTDRPLISEIFLFDVFDSKLVDID